MKVQDYAAPAPYAITPLRHGERLLMRASAVSGYTVAELTGPAKQRPVVQARWAVIVGLRRCGLSTTQIGRVLGNRDHSSIVHAMDKIPGLRAADPDFDRLCMAVAP